MSIPIAIVKYQMVRKVYFWTTIVSSFHWYQFERLTQSRFCVRSIHSRQYYTLTSSISIFRPFPDDVYCHVQSNNLRNPNVFEILRDRRASISYGTPTVPYMGIKSDDVTTRSYTFPRRNSKNAFLSMDRKSAWTESGATSLVISPIFPEATER